MSIDYAPSDDTIIPCEVRLWQARSVTVFVHPREWKKVSIIMGVPMVVSSCGITFTCMVADCGEHYRMGMVDSVSPQDFGVPTHGDYPATARIDWPSAIPDLLRSGLEGSPQLLSTWRSLSSAEMRSHLAYILRARRAGVIVERQLAVLRSLSP